MSKSARIKKADFPFNKKLQSTNDNWFQSFANLDAGLWWDDLEFEFNAEFVDDLMGHPAHQFYEISMKWKSGAHNTSTNFEKLYCVTIPNSKGYFTFEEEEEEEEEEVHESNEEF